MKTLPKIALKMDKVKATHCLLGKIKKNTANLFVLLGELILQYQRYNFTH